MTQIKHQLTIPLEYAGYRLDQALAALLPQYSRSRLKQWIQAGDITIDQNVWRPRDKITGNETVIIETELIENTEIEAENIDLNIVYEDKDILVINKPAGIIVHPGAGNRSHTLLNALLHHNPSLAELPRAGIVHRIDKDTSGLLVIAKTLPAHTRLVRALQRHKVSREYEAVVMGTLTGGGTIDVPIGRHPRFRTRMAVTDSGREAITHYRILERFCHYTHLSIQLETGRTHQIRVHMSYYHHPLVGDPVYNERMRLPKKASDTLISALKQFKRQALHARKLSFVHPITKESVTFEVDTPKDILDLLKILRKEDKKC